MCGGVSTSACSASLVLFSTCPYLSVSYASPGHVWDERHVGRAARAHTMYRCRLCQLELPLEAFVNRQRNNVRDGRDGACKACATDRTAEERERAKAEEVAKHFYEESRGQVDGRHRKVMLGVAGECGM